MAEKIIFAVCFALIAGYAAIEDYRHRIIPPITYLLFIALGIVKLIILVPTREHILYAALGLLIGSVPLLIVVLLSKDDGIGGGDIKIAATSGFFLWFVDSMAVVFISHILMGIFGLIYLRVKKVSLKKMAMPYAPFYAVTGIAILIFTCFI